MWWIGGVKIKVPCNCIPIAKTHFNATEQRFPATKRLNRLRSVCFFVKISICKHMRHYSPFVLCVSHPGSRLRRCGHSPRPAAPEQLVVETPSPPGRKWIPSSYKPLLSAEWDGETDLRYKGSQHGRNLFLLLTAVSVAARIWTVTFVMIYLLESHQIFKSLIWNVCLFLEQELVLHNYLFK